MFSKETIIRVLKLDRPWKVELAKAILFLGGAGLIFGLIFDDMNGRYVLSAAAQVKRNGLSPQKVEIAVLGSSHAMDNVKPVWFRRPTVSFARPGEEFFESAYKAQASMDLLPSLKTILISVSYFSFFYDNGRHTGLMARQARRISTYARFKGGAPLWRDLGYFLKGRLGNVITRDHLEWYFLYRLGYESMISKKRYLGRKEQIDSTPFIFKGDENSIPNQLILDMGEHLTLLGYRVAHRTLFTCKEAEITWYWYCRKKVPKDLRIRAFIYDETGMKRELGGLGDFVYRYPLEKWEPTQIVTYVQRIKVPINWDAKTLGLALAVDRRSPDKSNPRPPIDLVEADWPVFELEYPVGHLDPMPNNIPDLVKLYTHSCVRSQDQSDIIAEVLDKVPNIVDESYAVLKDMVLKIQEKGIRPVLFTAPFHKTYNARFPKMCQETMYKKMDQLQKETGVTYLDFARDERFENKASLFFNSDHLNHIGAKMFSLILNDIVVPPPANAPHQPKPPKNAASTLPQTPLQPITSKIK